jgi:hypothetical protein
MALAAMTPPQRHYPVDRSCPRSCLTLLRRAEFVSERLHETFGFMKTGFDSGGALEEIGRERAERGGRVGDVIEELLYSFTLGILPAAISS